MDDEAKAKLNYRKAALEKLSRLDAQRVEAAITIAHKRLNYIGRDGAIELVAALGEWLSQHKTNK